MSAWDYYILIFSPHTELEVFVTHARETTVFVYVLVVFSKVVMEGDSAKHLRRMFGSNKLLAFIDAKLLNQFELGN